MAAIAGAMDQLSKRMFAPAAVVPGSVSPSGEVKLPKMEGPQPATAATPAPKVTETGGLVSTGMTPPGSPVAAELAPDKTNPLPLPATNDDTVSANLARILKTDSPLMDVARQEGLNSANRRGMANTSIAGGASLAEMIKAATPIAQGDAQAALSKNLADMDRAAQMERLTYSTASTEKMQGADLAAQSQRLETQLASSDRQQDKDLASQLARLRESLAGADAQQKAEIEAQMTRLVVSGQQQLEQIGTSATQERTTRELQGRIDQALQSSGGEQQRALASLQGEISSRLQSQQDQATMTRLASQFAHDVQMADKDSAAQLQRIAASGDQDIRRLVEAGLQERETLSMSIASQDRQAIASAIVNIFNAEAEIRKALLSNPDMKASERSAYESAISALGDPVRAYINNLFSSGPVAAGTSATSGVPGTATGMFAGNELSNLLGGGVNPDGSRALGDVGTGLASSYSAPSSPAAATNSPAGQDKGGSGLGTNSPPSFPNNVPSSKPDELPKKVPY